MALFGSKKNTKKVSKKVVKTKEVAKVATHNSEIFHTIIRPRITEKATRTADKGVYVFDIQPKATKKAVATAVFDMYGVTPVKVAVAHIRANSKLVRGKFGKTAAGKKAYVYLKEGDKIEII